MRRTTRALAIGTLVVGGTLAVSAAPAQAASITCQTGFGVTNYYGRCNYPGPSLTQYRARVYCTDGTYRYGSWYYLNSGIYSIATCVNGNESLSGTMQFRS